MGGDGRANTYPSMASLTRYAFGPCTGSSRSAVWLILLADVAYWIGFG